jgi:hypothetical protein
MCAEASAVLRAVAEDFFFNWWYLEIRSDNRIRHIPRCVHYHEQGFRLGAFYNGTEIDLLFIIYLCIVQSPRPSQWQTSCQFK